MDFWKEYNERLRKANYSQDYYEVSAHLFSKMAVKNFLKMYPEEWAERINASQDNFYASEEDVITAHRIASELYDEIRLREKMERQQRNFDAVRNRIEAIHDISNIDIKSIGRVNEIEKPHNRKKEDDSGINHPDTAIEDNPEEDIRAGMVTIDTLKKEVGLDIPEHLKRVLDDNDIVSLEDVRKSGGFSKMDDADRITDEAASKTLMAHASLNLLATDVNANQRLIDKGYSTALDIQNRTKAAFIRSVKGILPEEEADALYRRSAAHKRLLTNRLTENLVSAKGHKKPNNKPKPQGPYQTGRCECRECEAATSPLAYLADLMDYCIEHITMTPQGQRAPARINLDILESAFRQPFTTLPATCEADQGKVSQVRVCLEVLMKYLQDHHQEQLGQPATQTYLNHVYHQLLSQVGTSESEIDSVRNIVNPFEQPSALKEWSRRLGLPIDDRCLERLNRMKLAAQSSHEEGGLHEGSLESLFGLKGIQSEPFANSVIRFDEHAQLHSLRLDGPSWSINTDDDGRLYGTLAKDAGGILVALYKAPSRDHRSLVCSGQINTVQGTIALEEKHYSGLSGSVGVRYKQDSKFEATAVPEFLSWRLTAVRQAWKAKDRPDGDAYDSATHPAVVIDPDLIGPDDFRSPHPKRDESSADGPFDLWLRRREWVDGRLTALESVRKPDGEPDLQALMDGMSEPMDTYPGAVPVPWSMLLQNGGTIDLEALHHSLEQGDKEVFQHSSEIVRTHLHLDPDAFKRLMGIKLKDDNQEAVSSAEWQDVYDILIRAMKTSLYPHWREEERRLAAAEDRDLLSPSYFWVSGREPVDGVWPPAYRCAYPLMDPEHATFKSLPKHMQGSAGAAIWAKRLALIERQFAQIKRLRETEGLDAAINHAVGHPNPGDNPEYAPDTLLEELNSGDAPQRDRAASRIVNHLFMSVDSFVLLMAVRARATDSIGDDPPSEAEWDAVYHLLKQASVRKREYETWKAEEDGLPVIEAQRIDANDLPEQTAGETALAWLARRRDAIDAWREKLWRKRKAGIAAILEAASVNADELMAWKDGLNDNDPEKAFQSKLSIWDNLKLPLNYFLQLMRLISSDDGARLNALPTLEEWKQIVAHLQKIIVNRDLHPQWREGEEPHIRSGYWKLHKARLPRRRAGIDQRASWQQALRRRSVPAVIDPDVFGPELLRFSIRDDANAVAFRLHEARAGALKMKHRLIRHSFEEARRSGTGAEWMRARLQKEDLVTSGVVTVHALGLSEGEFEDLRRGILSGKALTTRSAQLGLTPHALTSLADACQLVERVTGDDDYWKTVIDTLLEAEKACWLYPTWLREERDNDIVIGPAHFTLETDENLSKDNISRSPEGFAQRLWRQRHTDFQRVLKSRIEQEQAVIESVRAAVNTAEEAVLPDYRDRLLEAYGDHGICSGDPATWATRHLLIDASMGGCRKTTRVAQAIETLQGLLWQSRRGQFVDADGTEYAVDAEDFDDDWQWIGSYATWRTAMFVYLYPENLLSPTLRRWQTPAFREVAKNIRSVTRLTRKDACELAVHYGDYLRDICNLTLEATCSAEFAAASEACDHPQAAIGDKRDALIMFARSRETHVVYWCAADPDDKSLMGGLPWQPVPNVENVLNIIGAAPYDVSDELRYVYLFLRTANEDTQKLVFTRLDLTQGFHNPVWETEPVELSSPLDSDRFTAVIRQTNDCRKPPYLAVRTDSGAIYGRRLNVDVDGWENRDWRALADDTAGSEFTEILSLVESKPNGFYLFARDTNGSIKYRVGLSSGPAAVCSEGGQVYLFIRNTQNELLCGAYTNGWVGRWHQVEAVDRSILSDPAPVAWNSPGNDAHLQVFARYTEFQCRNWELMNGNHLGSQFNQLAPQQGPSDGLASKPCAVYDYDSNSVLLIGRAEEDGTLVYRDETRGWQKIDNTILRSDPAAISWKNGRIDVFFRNEENSLGHIARHDEQWSTMESLGGVLSSGPAATKILTQASRNDEHRIDVFVRGGNQTVYQKTLRCSTSSDESPPVSLSTDWSDTGWKSIGGISTSDPSAVVIEGNHRRSAQIVTFVRGLDGNLWHRTCQLDENTEPWSPWERVRVANGERYQLSERKDEGWYRLLHSNCEWMGAFAWAGSDAAYCFWKLYVIQLGRKVIFGLPMTADRVFPDEAVIIESNDFGKLAPNCGAAISNQYMTLVGSQKVAPDATINAILVGLASQRHSEKNKLSVMSSMQLTPEYNGPFNLSPPTTPKTFSDRRSSTAHTYKLNARASAQVKACLEEAFYALPILLGMSLRYHQRYQTALDWLRSVYNYAAPIEDRKIFYGLRREENLPLDYDRPDDWLADPLDPHFLARQRRHSYTRFALFCIIQCLLDYADAEFTTDTAETLPKARTMYQTVLDLLDSPEVTTKMRRCADVVGALTIDVDETGTHKAWRRISHEIAGIGRPEEIEDLVDRIQREVLTKDTKPYDQISLAYLFIHKAKSNCPPQSLFSENQRSGGKTRALTNRSMLELLADDDLADSLRRLGEHQAVKGYMPEPKFQFCIPANPIPDYYRAHAENNLQKLRTCRNIAGMQRPVDPYAAATDAISGLPQVGAGGQLVLPGTLAIRPTQYRYRTLVERAKQLVNVAQQMEAAFLSALEKRDAELYGQLRARQDAQLAMSQMGLHDLRATEAVHGVRLAILQKERSETIKSHFGDLIQEGWLWQETAALVATATSGLLHLAAGGAALFAASSGGTIGGAAGTAGSAPSGGTAAPVTAPAGAAAGAAAGTLVSQFTGGLSSLAAAVSSTASILQTLASYERRLQEWKFQERLAIKDVAIGQQQILLATDKKNIVDRERKIAKLQSDNANDVVKFLTNKFTSAELYEWMSGVLENAYRFFLQQATSMAKLAENQLAFERQETPVTLIQADYWAAPEDGGGNHSSDEKSADRRGLTGSARLLKDIYQLDQRAFESDRRKLQLSKTVSLARHDPLAFHQFRETGTMIFDTPMSMFDRDFPGHYLRLIKRVRASVIALVPSTEGIKATLTSLGISRVVIGGDLFQEVVVRRNPESVALTSPLNATGLFDLQEDPDKLFPFEATGVDTRWEFSMPKASNLFDFRTIADVLVTIEYTALNSYDYRQQVIQRLDRHISLDRPYSLRQQFVDQWYALNNPKINSERISISFSTRREDFPPNIENPKIMQMTLYVATKTGDSFDHEVTLLFKEHSADTPVGGSAKLVENIISTRRVNSGSWSALTGLAPIGTWELSLPNTENVRNRFKSGDIEDILLVITLQGQTPPWPL